MKPANKLKIPTLSKEWCDLDYVLLHAAFELLRIYVEEEHGGLEGMREMAQINEDSESWRDHYAEVEELYAWWLRYPTRGEPWRAKTLEGENKLYEEDTEMLVRLCKTREGLWT